jgi:hypothetical protein
VVRSGPAGADLDITATTANLSLKNDVLNEGDVRVVGIGLEIHNTTSNILKGGALITYRVPDAPLVPTIGTNVLDASGSVTCTSTSNQCFGLAKVPETASQAIDLQGSIEWEAKDGAYIVPILSEPVNPPLSIQPMGMYEMQDGNDSHAYYPVITNVGTMALNNNFNLPIPFSISGAYLTGLSNETTLQVNLVYYVEIFPYMTSTLRRVLQPATGLDSKALELYNHISTKLPTGVKVKENFLGGFISGVAKLASQALKWIPKIVGGISAGVQVYDTINSAMAGQDNDISMGRMNEMQRGLKSIQGKPWGKYEKPLPRLPGNYQEALNEEIRNRTQIVNNSNLQKALANNPYNKANEIKTTNLANRALPALPVISPPKIINESRKGSVTEKKVQIDNSGAKVTTIITRTPARTTNQAMIIRPQRMNKNFEAFKADLYKNDVQRNYQTGLSGNRWTGGRGGRS